MGYPLQYSGLENAMDCIVHGVAKSRTRLSDCHSGRLMNMGPFFSLAKPCPRTLDHNRVFAAVSHSN